MLLSPSFAAAQAAGAADRTAEAQAQFDRAESLRLAIEQKPEAMRTRADYDHALDAYRLVYHGDPAFYKSDESISNAAGILAEEGRLFHSPKLFRDAIVDCEFLRSEYPGSRFRFAALIAEGEIYQHDLKDLEQARLAYEDFLQSYPRNPLAAHARSALKEIQDEELTQNKKAIGAVPEPEESIQPPLAAPANAAAESKMASQPTPEIPASAALPLAPPAKSTVAEAAPSVQQQNSFQPQPIVAQDLAPKPAASLHGRTPDVTAIRYWSTADYTRIAIDLEDQVSYETARVSGPDRVYFDLHGTHLVRPLAGKSISVTDAGYLKRIRVAQYSENITRIVLDVGAAADYSAFFLPDPWRLIIDIRNHKPGVAPLMQAKTIVPVPAVPPANHPPAPPAPSVQALNTSPALPEKQLAKPVTPSVPQEPPPQGIQDPIRSTVAETTQDVPGGTRSTKAQIDSQSTAMSPNVSPIEPSRSMRAGMHAPRILLPAPPKQEAAVEVATATVADRPAVSIQEAPPAAPRVEASHPEASDPEVSALQAPESAAPDVSSQKKPSPLHPLVVPSAPAAPVAVASAESTEKSETSHAVLPPLAESGSENERGPSLARTLGLKIGRIVIDPGHGGHDCGTTGPGGIQEKDIVLDVALRLGKLLKQRLGADIVFTRDDDTFIPLETRTAIANKARADLFISVHANSSPDSSARGVESYYLNFTTAPDALEVAARENSVSDESIFELSDLVKQITLKDKIEESRAFAGDVQRALYDGLEQGNPGLKDRGVKKAPFVVLIGANMPSILAEISFLTNPKDARELRQSAYRQRIAESLYRGIARYINGLNGIRLAENQDQPGAN